MLVGCTSIPTPSESLPVPSLPVVPTPVVAQISCQPFGYPPAPVDFTFTPGPITAAGAEQVALDLFDACAADTQNGAPTAAITTIDSDVQSDTGGPNGPNAGQPVWMVQIDVTLKDNPAQHHSWTEVNQATGVPTIMGLG
jgi:hypothetical protein